MKQITAVVFVIILFSFAYAAEEDPPIVTFAIKLFNTPLPDKFHYGFKVEEFTKHFGAPVTTRNYTKQSREPGIILKMTEWVYKGFTITTSEPYVVGSTTYNKGATWLDTIVITDSDVKLQYNVAVGMEKAKIMELFGKPFHRTNNSFVYGISTTTEVGVFMHAINVNIRFLIDKDDKITKIKWKSYAD